MNGGKLKWNNEAIMKKKDPEAIPGPFLLAK